MQKQAAPHAKERAIQLARVQATDDEIKAVLCVECGMTESTAERRVGGWSKKGLLEKARVAGRLLPLETLRAAAEKGDVQAATALNKRQELLDGLDIEFLREVRRIMALEPEALGAELAKLSLKLKAA